MSAEKNWQFDSGTDQVRSNQPPVPSPWNRSGNMRFKRRTGSNRAETKVK